MLKLLVLIIFIVGEYQPKYKVNFNKDVSSELIKSLCLNFTNDEVEKIKDSGGLFLQFRINANSKEILKISISEHAESYFELSGNSLLDSELKAKILLEVDELNLVVLNVDRFPESANEEVIHSVFMVPSEQILCPSE